MSQHLVFFLRIIIILTTFAIDYRLYGQFGGVKVSEHLKKQLIAVEGETDEVKEMLKEHDKLVEEIFHHEDKDKNGFISFTEFSGPKHDEL